MKTQSRMQSGIILVLGLGLIAPRALALGTVIPESPAKGLYGGVSAGVGGNTDLEDSWDDGSLSNRDTDMLDPVYKVVVGYKINSYVSAEGSYRNLGTYSLDATVDGSGSSWGGAPGDRIGGEQESEGWSISVTGRWPISERWTLAGTIGWFWWESTETYTINGAPYGDLNESGSDITFSGGVEFDHGYKDRIVYTAELGHNRVGDDNLDIISGFVGILYRFP